MGFLGGFLEIRNCARLLLLDPVGRLLLIECRSPDDPARLFWITPGGGMERGETLRDAARRELWEETGDAEARIGPAVWTRRHVFDWDGRRIDQRETFFLARTPVHGARPAALSAEEKRFIRRYRWWTPEEIESPPPETTFAPRRLARFLGGLLRGEIPGSPIDVGV